MKHDIQALFGNIKQEILGHEMIINMLFWYMYIQILDHIENSILILVSIMSFSPYTCNPFPL